MTQKTKSTPVSAAVYVRISSDADGREVGVVRQEKDCRRSAEDSGWTVAEVYKDNDMSAWRKDGKRPAFLKMLDDVKAGKRDGIIIYNLDRFTRRMDDAVDIVKIVENKNVPILDSETSWDLTEPKQQERFYDAANTNFKSSNDTQRRTKRGLLDKIQRGEAMARGHIFGYTYTRATHDKPGYFTINENEAKIVREIYRRCISGESLGGITADLNKRGITTVDNKQWTTGKVGRLIDRPTNAAIVSHNGKIYEDVQAQWKPIVPKTTYNAAQEKRAATVEEARKRNTRKRQPKRGLLVGLCRCAECTYNMHHTKKIRKNKDGTEVEFMVYQCNREGCRKVSRNAEPIERLVTKTIDKVLKDRKVDVPKPDNANKEELDRLIGHRKTLKHNMALGKLSMDDYMEMKPTVDGEIERLEKQMAQSASVIPETDLVKLWNNGTLSQKQAVIKMFIEYIVVDKSSRGKNFDYDSIKIKTL